MKILPYSKKFFNKITSLSLSSANVIVPLIMDLIRPKSVLDVGCGLGAFLSIFLDHNVQEVLGIDGDYVKQQELLIPKNKFIPHDLTKKLELNKQFDLVVSLEVAEHLPKKNADTFVNSLVSHGDAILFSAAIPYQRGTHHINEQWPEYWVHKFQKCGYQVIDCVRKKIWDSKNVSFWYAQNILLFIKTDKLSHYPHLSPVSEKPSSQLSIVHPQMLHETIYHYPLHKLILKRLIDKLTPKLKPKLKISTNTPNHTNE